MVTWSSGGITMDILVLMDMMDPALIIKDRVGPIEVQAPEKATKMAAVNCIIYLFCSGVSFVLGF